MLYLIFFPILVQYNLCRHKTEVQNFLKIGNVRWYVSEREKCYRADGGILLLGNAFFWFQEEKEIQYYWIE